ncbi:DHS-like NAD/FAD-binding domain-containing protein [Mycena pura]|uniref:DHS-like NAD/FAD-binding domain-containing protein n=1 Tax=Mycena pura TaxID=153505 RepID=A0AAD6VWN8_9AGAR|nr:DHS-like NAD/FAD-binding domain-containing protein [Mycena pura]
MTLFVPLDSTAPVPVSPTFLRASANPTVQLQKTIKAILKAKRIVIVCGAGISVQAGIPDFRSPEGLFQTLKRDNPKESLVSGKDLFDASVFHNLCGERKAELLFHALSLSENTTSLFCQMIARLSELSNAAEPTPFHLLLRNIDDRGRLLRVYTQNIDAIEQKSGLSFGVPPFQEKRSKPRALKTRKSASSSTSETEFVAAENIASSSRLPTPPVETPRCIPLHGTLQTVHCQICNHSFALADHLPSLGLGTPPACPECIAMEETRQLVGKRARGIGRLRPSVVLYNEAHKDGEGVGEVVRRDLLGLSKGKGRSGADLLLVVGTSLRVQGTKRVVREFAKAVRARGKDGCGSNCPSPTPLTGGVEEDPPVKTLYLNLDFPVPTREWEGVFDAWVQGDAQLFAEMVQAELDKETRSKAAASEKKRRKDEEEMGDSPKKRKPATAKAGDSPKRRKISVTLPPTPPRSGPAPALTSPVKLMVTIPARRRLIPEVFITSGPHRAIQLPPTPENTPPRRARKPMKEVRVESVKSKIALKSLSPSPSPEPNAADDTEAEAGLDANLLPSFVRQLQYGLRSRSSSRSRG